MFCPYCGAQIEDKMKFCFNCGKSLDFSDAEQTQEVSVEENKTENVVEEHAAEPVIEEAAIIAEESTQASEEKSAAKQGKKVENTASERSKEKSEKKTSEETIIYSSGNNSEKKTMTEKAKGKLAEAWSKLSIFGKISTVVIIAAVLLGLIALMAGRIFAMIIAIIQIVVVVVALLMKKEVIKVPKKWISPLLLGLAIVLVVPFFSLFKVDIADYEKYAWEDVILADMLPEPESPYGKIDSNSESYLSLSVLMVKEEEYNEYVEACKEAGFTIDAELIGINYYAYNEAGYKLVLNYYDYNSEMHVGLDVGMQLGELSWSSSEMAQLLPVPDSKVGEIQKDDETGYAVYVGNMSKEIYANYVIACEEKGFTVDANKQEKHFTAKNAESYKLSMEYKGNSIVYISIEEPEFSTSIEVECVENWFFSKYDVEVYVDDNLEGTITHGSTETYDLILTKGNHVIKFVSVDDETLSGSVEIIVSKDETFKFMISCSSTGIDVDTVSGTVNQPESTEQSNGTEESQETETTIPDITITISEEDFKGMNYEEAEKKFREMGFTSFEYETVDSEIEADNDTICYIEITEVFIGDSDFEVGDTFDADSTVTFYTYKYEAPAAPSPVFYSTNDYDTAKNGNSGVFSYRERGGSYDIYWIIDFDEGYVYYFTDGNGESFCDRLKIDSGTLNDAVTITYHDGGDTWSYKLHFKYVDHPETLIMVDQNGFDWEYSTTDLDDALEIRATKNIKDY